MMTKDFKPAMNNPAPLVPKPCPKCGAAAEVGRSGSHRFWVQCSGYLGYGNCTAIGPQTDNKKEAILKWNAMK